MQENESDGEGGWSQPDEYVSPWAPRDEDEDASTRWPGANAARPPENGDQDTIAFGSPPSSSGRDGQGSYVQPGYGSQPGYEQAWYGSQDSHGSQGHGARATGTRATGTRTAYGQGGYQGRGDSGDPAGHQAGGGYGAPGWASPDPPPGRPGRGGRFLVYLTVAALAAGIGAGVTVALNHHSPAPSAGISSGDVPGPNNNAAGSGSSAPLNAAAVEKKVSPGLVDITSTLKYESETAEGTGMIISSSGLVLTNNHVIDGATVVRATLVGATGNTYPAQVVGYDATDDVALLQLQGASGLPIENFGNSSQVSLGTPVLALGNAEGQGGAKAVRASSTRSTARSRPATKAPAPPKT